MDGVLGTSSLPVDVTSIPGRPPWALGLLGEGLTVDGGRAAAPVRVKPSPQQPGWSAEGGRFEALGSRCVNPSWDGGSWQVARRAGHTPLDAQGWVALGGWRQSPRPGAPAVQPRCWVNSPSNSCRL